jgi:hypothetical protein
VTDAVFHHRCYFTDKIVQTENRAKMLIETMPKVAWEDYDPANHKEWAASLDRFVADLLTDFPEESNISDATYFLKQKWSEEDLLLLLRMVTTNTIGLVPMIMIKYLHEKGGAYFIYATPAFDALVKRYETAIMAV